MRTLWIEQYRRQKTGMHVNMATVQRLIVCVMFVGSVTGQLKDCRLQGVVDDFWSWRLENVPEFASSVNVRDFQDKVESYSLNAFADRKAKVDGFLRRLRVIQKRTLHDSDQVTYDVLEDTLQTYADGYKWRDYGPMTPFNFLGGQQTDTNYYLGLSTFNSEKDYEDFLSRITLITQRIYDSMERMNRSIDMKTTYHNVSMVKVIDQIDKILKFNVTSFAWYTPYTSQLEELSLPADTVANLRARAETEIRNYLDSMQNLKDYLNQTYLPNTRQEYGVWSFKNGEEYYRACLKWHLSLDITAEEVHNLGLSEVARISQEMQDTMTELKFEGTVKEFFDNLRSRDEFLLADSEEVLKRFRAVTEERVEPQINSMFKNLGDIYSPVDVKAMTYDGPPAIYKNGAPDGSRLGVMYVNTFDPKNNPTYSIPVLALHEGDPGHHIQDLYALNSKNLPDFRKSTDFTKYWAVPLHFPFYTAYSEGWALYAESLGDELEIYRDGYERMGRYSSEIFRACRLVVDTGIHHYRWSRQQAIDYMLNYTANSEESIEREINRYITWPGQATSYKVGGIKFKQIRQKAINALAPTGNFDIKSFHFLLLDSGAMPLSVMENLVDDWIASEKQKYCIDVKECPTAAAPTNQNVCYVLLVTVVLALNLL